MSNTSRVLQPTSMAFFIFATTLALIERAGVAKNKKIRLLLGSLIAVSLLALVPSLIYYLIGNLYLAGSSLVSLDNHTVWETFGTIGKVLSMVYIPGLLAAPSILLSGLLDTNQMRLESN